MGHWDSNIFNRFNGLLLDLSWGNCWSIFVSQSTLFVDDNQQINNIFLMENWKSQIATSNKEKMGIWKYWTKNKFNHEENQRL